MKTFNYRIFQLHLKELPKCNDPYDCLCYTRGAIDISSSFNLEQKSTGILNRNDVIQECHTAMVEAWENLNWEILSKKKPQANIWGYLKKSIKLTVRHRIHEKKDGVRIPRNKRWQITETKDVNDFLSQLFPTDYFLENDERMGLYEDPYLTRYDVFQLAIALDIIMDKTLTVREKRVIEFSYGIDFDKRSAKEIAQLLNTSVAAVNKTKHTALQKLKSDEVKKYLKHFYYTR